MKLTFLGTRGNIDVRTRRHRRHSSLRISYRGRGVVLDWGEDWLERRDELRAEAVAVTHAHPDHADGLKRGVPCPVYATAASWEIMRNFDVANRRVAEPRVPFEAAGMTIEAFPLDHSTRAPAVGYRVRAGAAVVFYVPDVAWIRDRAAALRGVDLYVGDGATLTRSMVRKPGDEPIGHAPIGAQLGWCACEGVPRAVFTHCGSGIVNGDERKLGPKLRRMAEERGVEATFAYDGLEIVLR
jgi:phosphoribosyl 1,2-cyclic phosphodiesterase